MEVTVVSLARCVLDGVLSSARTALADEVARVLGVPKEVEFIRYELEMMQSALKDASAQAAGRNDTVRTLVKQLRDHAYDFEDCLLDFTLYADRTSSSRAGSWKPSTVGERQRLAARIRDLKASVEALNLRKERYRIFTDLAAAARAEENAPARLVADDHGDEHSSADDETAFKESDIVGRRDDKAKLKRLISRVVEPEIIHEEDQAVTPTSTSLIRGLTNLLYSYVVTERSLPSIGGGASATGPLQVSLTSSPGSNGGSVSVVSVWGMGGMGKSSLVRMVHNDPDVIAEFDSTAWVTVPHPLDNPRVFRKRLRKELGLAPDKKIEEYLQKRRYLVVVDDLHTKEEWETVWQVFRQFHNDNDSRIIVTTRWKDVARHCAAAGHVPDGHELIYELKPLGEEESKSLLCQKVYKNCDLPPDMEEQARYILGKCCGLPLAICTIGGFLASRPKTSTEWRNLHEHLGAELEYDLDNIRKVILSSYDGLPYHLKSIFLYLSIFPENHEIRRTRLLRRWMAEGYIAKKREMPEDVASRFYNDLISRSMIQGSKASRGVGVDRCQVHSMVREIILSKSTEEIQLFLNEGHSNDIPQSKIRHLVVSRWKSRDEKLQNINLSSVRSLTIFGEYPASLISPKLVRLRVLDLEDTVNLKNGDLEHIGELPHLRYLSLRGTGISKLPSSLQNLRYLETLDIQDTEVTQLPSSVAKLEKLCYLLAGINFSKDLLRKMESKHNDKDSLLPCLCGKPGECCKVFDLSAIAPEGIEKLQNLQMLGVINVGNGNGVAGRVKKLTNLTNLRRLGVAGLTEKEGQNLCQSIGELRRLQRLEVRSDSLTFLAQTPPKIPGYLDSLRLCGNLGSLPKWISSLNDLAKVKLLGTQLKQEDIQHLQYLPNLTLLGLWEKSYTGNSLYFCAGTFLKLKFLDIDGLDEIKTVTIEKDTMPKLKKLWVNECPSLHDNNYGLSGVPYLLNLNELVLKKCGKKENLLRILQRQVSDHINRPKLLVGKSMVLRARPRTPTADQ